MLTIHGMIDTETTTHANVVTKIIAYEDGLLDEAEVIDLYQYLVDSGMAWSLQGHYGRTAEAMIDYGYVTR